MVLVPGDGTGPEQIVVDDGIRRCHPPGLEQDPRIHLFYSNNVDELAKADILILPGSKSTLDDLYEIRRNGVAQAILRARREGATVLGICGGYQMMGRQIRDPQHVEGTIEAMPGLGLLPMVTEMLPEKVTRQVRFGFADGQAVDFSMEGYEIHMGETRPADGSEAAPLVRFADGQTDGCRVDDKCMGCYIHGIPFLSFRLISDTAEDHAGTWESFWQQVGPTSFRLIRDFLQNL